MSIHRFLRPAGLTASLILVTGLGSAAADGARDYELGARAFETEDLITAIRHLDRAALEGHAGALLLLGYIYDKAEENALAADYYLKAYQSGSSEAAVALGTMYASGDGVQRDQDLARDWYEKAAASGNAMAQETLGLAYLKGELGLPKDERRGRELLQRAADAGHEPARQVLSDMDASAKKGN